MDDLKSRNSLQMDKPEAFHFRLVRLLGVRFLTSTDQTPRLIDCNLGTEVLIPQFLRASSMQHWHGGYVKRTLGDHF